MIRFHALLSILALALPASNGFAGGKDCSVLFTSKNAPSLVARKYGVKFLEHSTSVESLVSILKMKTLLSGKAARTKHTIRGPDHSVVYLAAVPPGPKTDRLAAHYRQSAKHSNQVTLLMGPEVLDHGKIKHASIDTHYGKFRDGYSFRPDKEGLSEFFESLSNDIPKFNEIVFRSKIDLEGVPLKIIVPKRLLRTLMHELKQAGVDSFNGDPIEKLIVVPSK